MNHVEAPSGSIWIVQSQYGNPHLGTCIGRPTCTCPAESHDLKSQAMIVQRYDFSGRRRSLNQGTQTKKGYTGRGQEQVASRFWMRVLEIIWLHMASWFPHDFCSGPCWSRHTWGLKSSSWEPQFQVFNCERTAFWTSRPVLVASASDLTQLTCLRARSSIKQNVKHNKPQWISWILKTKMWISWT